MAVPALAAVLAMEGDADARRMACGAFAVLVHFAAIALWLALPDPPPIPQYAPAPPLTWIEVEPPVRKAAPPRRAPRVVEPSTVVQTATNAPASPALGGRRTDPEQRVAEVEHAAPVATELEPPPESPPVSPVPEETPSPATNVLAAAVPPPSRPREELWPPLEPEVFVAPRLGGHVRWSCPWPHAAADAGVKFETVRVQVTVDTDGRALAVKVVEDPGFGFGDQASACALHHTYVPGRNRAGQAVRGTTLPFSVEFGQ